MEAAEVGKGFALFIGILFFLYFFLVSLDLLGNSFKIIAGDGAGDLFNGVSNPLAGLMVGILATVMLQSSSTSTSIVVAMVGAEVLPVPTAIPIVFGANIGTSVTNTIVSIGFVGEREQYRRGFAGATVHDMFNYLNVLLWLPLEIIVSAIRGGDGGIYFLMSEAMAKGFDACDKNKEDCEKWEGPFKIITSAISKKIISVDKDVIKDFSIGRPEGELCQTLCENESAGCSYKFNRKKCTTSLFASSKTICGMFDSSKNKTVSKKEKAKFTFCGVNATTGGYEVIDTDALAGAQEHYDNYILNKDGVFYDAGSTDEAAGWVTLVVSLILLMVCLVGMIKLLGIAVRGRSEEVLKKALNMNGYLAIIVGAGVTMLVQSSSITTSTLTPLVALGTLTLEGMLPLTVGANIGTTVTGVLASLVGSSKLGFQIAIVHVMFNIFGAIVFYPFPPIRAIPLRAARKLGDLAATFKPFPLFYIFMAFVLYPGIILAVSIGFGSGNVGSIVGAVIGLLALIVAHIAFFWWYFKMDGHLKLVEKFGHQLEIDEEKANTQVGPGDI